MIYIVVKQGDKYIVLDEVGYKTEKAKNGEVSVEMLRTSIWLQAMEMARALNDIRLKSE